MEQGNICMLASEPSLILSDKVGFYMGLRISIVLFLLMTLGCFYSKKAEIYQQNVENSSEKGNRVEQEITDYILGPGDEFEIIVWRHDDLNRKVKVIYPGKFFYPMVGEIDTIGVGVSDIRKQITEKLNIYVDNPQVSVMVTSSESKNVAVLGEVNHPGIFNVNGPLPILQAIVKAEGFTHDARQDSVMLIRGNFKEPGLFRVNCKEVLKRGIYNNMIVKPGDIIYVPTSFVANLDRFSQHLSNYLSPWISLYKVSYLERLLGKETTTDRGNKAQID